MKPLMLVANWKMNGRIHQLKQWLEGLRAGLGEDQLVALRHIALVLCPPFPYLLLPQLGALREKDLLGVGAQDASVYGESGAYTAECAASMLKDVGCGWVIVGHSERRTLFHESNGICAQKFKQVQQAGLRPILCVGETLAERSEDRAWASVKQQLQESAQYLEDLGSDCAPVIAYEPLWAIGSGQQATPEQAQAMHAQIKTFWATQLGRPPGSSVSVLYGGSLKPENAAALFAQPDIDGGLIGGASLKVDSFLDMVTQLAAAKLK